MPVPAYLQQYIVEQDASLYTPIDHASWRFILKISRDFFAKHAHSLYLEGLLETGISTDRIPLISEMDEKLQRFGWHAVAVSGFIPPAVFMEFLSRGILPIACDMRKLENLSYTPAPDIVHEAAGHAPIIADPAYARYLRHYGELAEKAIYSSQDLAVYEAVRKLSEIKEDPSSTSEQIDAVQRELDSAASAVDHVSEATQLGRMGWWTIEYGLLGDVNDPKIYGAGLLSSVSESFHCLDKSVKKIPFSPDCVNITYDITKPQPQLFIAKNFETLAQGLDALTRTMAYRRGGTESLEKARKAAVPTTAVLDTGIQISGTLVRFRTDSRGEPAYLSYQGPAQLSFKNQELPDQGASYHREGFGTPVGKIRSQSESAAGVQRLEFESGVTVEGELIASTEREGKKIILTFKNCTVKLKGEILFDPSWGIFDMACGTAVTSVFGGAADRSKYLAATGGFKQDPRKPKTNLTEENRGLNALYAQVRKLRDDAAKSKVFPESARETLLRVYEGLQKNHPKDWLLRYELLELDALYSLKGAWAADARARLGEIAGKSRDKKELIERGLKAL